MCEENAKPSATYMAGPTISSSIHQETNKLKNTIWVWIAITIIVLSTLIGGCTDPAWAQGIILTASWYSIADLKRDGQWNKTKGVMANGRQFSDDGLTAASWDWPLGTKVKVTKADAKTSVVVLVSDRPARRFKGKRIDLSKKAFSLLAPCKQGIVSVRVETI